MVYERITRKLRYSLILSHFILKEKITKGKIMGNLIIIAGILIYTL